jgi:transcription antitermination factor NusG
MISQDFVNANKAQPWFALRVRSNHEQVASLHLRSRGFEEFSPSYKAQRQWSDRKRTTDQSLFPGYVFCRLNAQDRLPVLTVPGVVGIVGFGDGPTIIPEDEVARVRAMLNSGLVVMPWPFLKIGEMVLIERGPLAGVEGLLQEVKGKYRIVVSINLLQRSVSSEIDRAWVRPLKISQASEVTPGSPRGIGELHMLNSPMAIK